MGDRYELELPCAYCDAENEVWFAPTSGSDTFKCSNCGNICFVNAEQEAMKLEDVTEEIVADAFLSCTSVSWSDEDMKRMAKRHLTELKEVQKPCKK